MESFFAEDDYFEVWDEYFKPIVHSGEPYLEPSGYLGAQPRATSLVRPISVPDPTEYRNDSSASIAPFKAPLVNLISKWDNTVYGSKEITLCHSVTVASAVTLSLLTDLGVGLILFESPCYYATYYQAKKLDIPCARLPAFRHSGFRVEIPPDALLEECPIAVWLTQPRISLGYNQRREDITRFLGTLRRCDYLILDEATERSMPSHLRDVTTRRGPGPTVLKLRSMFKGVGLNGVRLAVIIHPSDLKGRISLAMWLFQGGLDVFSLEFGRAMAEDYSLFQAMLVQSGRQVSELRARIERATAGTRVGPSPIENGYIGSLTIDLDGLGQNSREARRILLDFMAKKRVVGTLSSAMMFAYDDSCEFLRLNYYLPPQILLKACLELSRLC